MRKPTDVVSLYVMLVNVTLSCCYVLFGLKLASNFLYNILAAEADIQLALAFSSLATFFTIQAYGHAFGKIWAIKATCAILGVLNIMALIALVLPEEFHLVPSFEGRLREFLYITLFNTIPFTCYWFSTRRS